MSERWTPESWRAKPIQQVPDYPDQAALKAVEQQLAGFPPLVFAGEARKLKRALGQGRGRRGLPAPGRRLRRELRRAFGRQHPRFLPPLPADGGGADLRRRLAGGEGRPHRRPVRQAALGPDRDDRRRRAAELPGDIVNDIAFTPEARIPDPRRQLEAYRQSAATLNLIRAFATGGYANLENAHRWMLGFVKD